MRSEKLLRQWYQGDKTNSTLYKEFRPYMNLCIAIIARACQDYASGGKGKTSGVKAYNRSTAESFFRSDWYRHVDYTGWFEPEAVMAEIDGNSLKSSAFRTQYIKLGEQDEGKL